MLMGCLSACQNQTADQILLDAPALWALIVSDCPGTIVRELSELSIWLDMVYDGNLQGLQEVWRGLIAAMDNCFTGSVTLDVMESYKILLPGSLDNGMLTKPVTFCSSNSRPMTFTGYRRTDVMSCSVVCSIVPSPAFELVLVPRCISQGQLKKTHHPRISAKK
jgi:hypothetical protein